MSLAAGAFATIAGGVTANPALATAGASIFTAAAIKLYNERVRKKVNSKTNEAQPVSTPEKVMLSGEGKGAVIIKGIGGKEL